MAPAAAVHRQGQGLALVVVQLQHGGLHVGVHAVQGLRGVGRGARDRARGKGGVTSNGGRAGFEEVKKMCSY